MRIYTKNINATASAIQNCGGSVQNLLTKEIIEFVECLERNGYEMKFIKNKVEGGQK